MKEITINGKATPIHFGMRAVAEFTKRQESDFAENITTTAAVGSIDSIVALTTVGLNEGARHSGSERRYTEDDVWDIFDEEPHLVLEVSQLFVESISPLTEKLGGMVKNGRAAAKRRYATAALPTSCGSPSPSVRCPCVRRTSKYSHLRSSSTHGSDGRNGSRASNVSHGSASAGLYGCLPPSNSTARSGER